MVRASMPVCYSQTDMFDILIVVLYDGRYNSVLLWSFQYVKYQPLITLFCIALPQVWRYILAIKKIADVNFYYFMQSGTTGRHKSVVMTHDNVSLPAPANMSELIA